MEPGCDRMEYSIEVEELEKKIVDVLLENPGLTARQIGALLDVYKGSINSLLYKSPRFVQDDSPRPCWFLTNTSKSTGSVQKPLVNPQPATTLTSTSNTRPVINAFDFDSLWPWQKKALKAWNDNERKGLVEAVTGTGKTRLAIAAIAEELVLGGKVAVIVPTVELQRQWYAELQRNFSDIQIGLLGNGNQDHLTSCDVLVAIVHSASRHDLGLRDQELGLLVADECHRYGAETFKKALEDGFRSRLGLTATRERPDGAHEELEEYFGKVVYTLGYKEAIEHRYIADVKVAQIAVNLDSAEQLVFDEMTEVISKTQFELSKRFGLKIDPYPKFMERVTRIAEEGEMRDSMAAKRYLSSIQKRKALLANTPQKLEVVKHLAESVRAANGTLFFTESIVGAEAICEELNKAGVTAATIHAGLSSKERQRAFLDFSDKRIKALTAVKVMDEGVDVPEADLAVIISASKTRRQMIQRMGRVLRLKTDGRKARFVFVFVAETSEDPSRGAHDEFWNEVLDIATSSRKFDIPSETKELTKFLDPKSQD